MNKKRVLIIIIVLISLMLLLTAATEQKCPTCGGSDTYPLATWITNKESLGHRISKNYKKCTGKSCRAWGGTWEMKDHSMSPGSWVSAGADQHKRTMTCSAKAPGGDCKRTTTETGYHSPSWGSVTWTITTGQHYKSRKCSGCGVSQEYERGNHTYKPQSGTVYDRCNTCQDEKLNTLKDAAQKAAMQKITEASTNSSNASGYGSTASGHQSGANTKKSEASTNNTNASNSNNRASSNNSQSSASYNQAGSDLSSSNSKESSALKNEGDALNAQSTSSSETALTTGKENDSRTNVDDGNTNESFSLNEQTESQIFEQAAREIKEDVINLSAKELRDKYGHALGDLLTNMLENEDLAVKVREEAEKDLAELKSDPANIATGDNVITITDIEYRYYQDMITIGRTYTSGNGKDFAFGTGWDFTYDTRMIYGVKYGYQEQIDMLNATIEETKRLQATITASFDQARDTMSLSVTSANEAMTFANEAITAMNKALDDITSAITHGTLAVSKGQTADNEITAAVNDATASINKAQAAINNASAAISYAEKAILNINSANSYASKSSSALSTAFSKCIAAENAVGRAISEIEKAISKLNIAKSEAKKSTVTSTITSANNAYEAAKNARDGYVGMSNSISQILQTLNALQGSLNSIKSKSSTLLTTANSNKGKAQSRYSGAQSQKTSVQGILNRLQTVKTTITATYDNAVAALTSANNYKVTVTSELAEAESTLSKADQRKQDATAYLAFLNQEENSIADEIAATLNDLTAKLRIAEQEAYLARTNEARNKYTIDPDFYAQHYMSNCYVTYIGMDGVGRLYKITAAPVYDTTALLADGSPNFYPNGSALTPVNPGDDSLYLNPDGTITVTRKNQTGLVYDINGRLQTITDNNGNTITFAFDGRKLLSITDDFGRTTTFTYTGTKISSITDPAGNVYGYTYTGDYLTAYTDPMGNVYEYVYANGVMVESRSPENGLLKYGYTTAANGDLLYTQVEDASGCAWKHEYHFDENYTIIKDRRGNASTYYYDEFKKTVKSSNPDGTFTTREYNQTFDLVKQTDEAGSSIYYDYDENRNLSRVTTAVGNTMTFTYDGYNRITSATDGNGNVSSFIYDANGNMVETRYPDGTSETYTYSTTGLLISSTDRRGNVTRYEFDAYGYVSKLIYPDGSDVTMQYDLLGNMVSSTDENGAVTKYTYDPLRKITGIENALGGTVTYNYRADGTIKDMHDALANGMSYQYDLRKKVSQTIDPLGNTTRYEYGPEEALTKIVMPDMSSFSYEYDARGQMITAVQNDLGITSRYVYDNTGRMTTTIDGNGNEQHYTYDAGGRVIKTVDPAGAVTTYEYDHNNNVISKTDPLLNNETYTYDSMNRLVQVVDAMGNYTYYRYDAAGNLIEQEDATGVITLYEYDSRNRLVKQIDAAGAVTTYGYDGVSQVIRKTDARGNVTRYAYDLMGHMIKSIDAAGGITTYTYDANGNVVGAVDANGNAKTYAYDTAGQVVKVIDEQGNSTSIAYNHAGKITKVTNALNNSRMYDYDQLGRLIKETNELGAVKTYTYDNVGNLIAQEDELGRIIQYAYDQTGRLTAITNALGETRTMEYDAVGNLITDIDAAGVAYRYEYDALNRVTKEINRLGNVQSYTYDQRGKVTHMTDFNGVNTTYTYDVIGRLLDTVYTDGSRKTFTYDALGNLTGAVNADSDLTYTFDVLNRLARVTDNKLNEVIDYTYDPRGNRTGIEWLNGGRTISYDYGSRGELLRVIDAERKAITFEYDVLGREVKRNFPNNTSMMREYDAANRLTKVVNAGRRGEILGAEAYLYNAAGQRVYDLDETGGIKKYTYDDLGRIREVQYPIKSGKKYEDFIERLDNGVYPVYQQGAMEGTVSLPTTIVEPGMESRLKKILNDRKEAYELYNNVVTDKNGSWIVDVDNTATEFKQRLTMTAGVTDELTGLFSHMGQYPNVLDTDQWMWTERFTYDVNSNRVAKANGWGSINYTYNAAYELTKAGQKSFSYDQNGNLKAESYGEVIAKAYNYNQENRVTDVAMNYNVGNSTKANGVHYTYDALGRRNSLIESLNNAGTVTQLVESNRRYLHDGFGINPLAEMVDYDLIYGGTSSHYGGYKPTAEYIRGNGDILSRGDFRMAGSRPRVGTREFYHTDAHGSVGMITGRTGSVVDRYTYDAFGTTYAGRFNDTNKLGYNGKPFDPVAGMSNYGFRDYHAAYGRWSTLDPIKDGNNWYEYCNNDPVNLIDPLGLCTTNPVGYVETVIQGTRSIKPITITMNGIEYSHSTPNGLWGLKIDSDAIINMPPGAYIQIRTDHGLYGFRREANGSLTIMGEEIAEFGARGPATSYKVSVSASSYKGLGAGVEVGIIWDDYGSLGILISVNAGAGLEIGLPVGAGFAVMEGEIGDQEGTSVEINVSGGVGVSGNPLEMKLTGVSAGSVGGSIRVSETYIIWIWEGTVNGVY